MTECPALSSITEDTLILHKGNINEMRPSVFDRSPGTVVTVNCNNGYVLVGQQEFSCTESGQWNYTTKPHCTYNPVATGTQSPPGGMDQDTKIMIGVICAIAGLIVIALVLMIIAIYLRDRRRRRERREFWGRIRDDRMGPDCSRGRYGPSTIDMEMYSRSPRDMPPPPPYDGRRYVHDWVKRSSQLGRDDEFFDRSGVYGRHRRDSHLWRDSNF